MDAIATGPGRTMTVARASRRAPPISTVTWTAPGYCPARVPATKPPLGSIIPLGGMAVHLTWASYTGLPVVSKAWSELNSLCRLHGNLGR